MPKLSRLALGFNPTLVRFERTGSWNVLVVALGFNPTLVRFEPQIRARREAVLRGFNPTLVRFERPPIPRRGFCSIGFNPTLVRFELCLPHIQTVPACLVSIPHWSDLSPKGRHNIL